MSCSKPARRGAHVAYGHPAGLFVLLLSAAARREGSASPLRSSMIPPEYQQPGRLTATVGKAGPNEFTFALFSTRGGLR